MHRCLLLLTLIATAHGQHRVALTDGWSIARSTAGGSRPATGSYVATAVPHTFEEVFGPSYDGTAWYRRSLALRPEWRDARVRVEFTAVATRATVFCNGTEVGRHLGGWTPFRVEIGQAAKFDGTDVLEVFVDELVGHDTQGFLPVIQPHFGGIWRPVELCVDTTPRLDRFDAFAFGDGGEGELAVDLGVLPGPEARDTEIAVRLLDGLRVVAGGTAPTGDGRASLRMPVAAPRGWSPHAPHLYRAECTLRDVETGDVLDRLVRRVGFRRVDSDATTLLWNGQPLQVRGMLHWGYEPPGFAPNVDPAHWRRELELVRSLGCNLVKACLWVPPREFFEIADELGVIVWQEYPTWHPQLTPEHLEDLTREFDEFYRHDRGHVSVAFRSLTCETGHSADVGVLQQLYDRAHAAVPQTLVIDDSSWISWLRVHDFWDEHPYGNNSWWPGKLGELRAYIGARTAMPLLLGECIASDTWFDSNAWHDVHSESRWHQPLCLDHQAEVSAWIRDRFGAATLESLLPISRAYALRNRKYQIERLRLSIPDAGYVLSVIRDFPKARMGFVDDLGRPKWEPAQWAWHRDTMLCLDTPRDRRAFAPGPIELPVRVSHFGRGELRGQLRLRIDGDPARRPVATHDLQMSPGRVSAAPTVHFDAPAVDRPQRFRLSAELGGSHPASNAWEFWIHPTPGAARPRGVRIVDRLDRHVLYELERGGRVLLRAGPRKHSLKTHDIWFLRGAPFAPPHPLHAVVPAELLTELQSFDLEQPRVLHWHNFLDEVDPILAFWDSHDIPTVNRWLFAFDCRVGEGRLLATVLDHESSVGRWVLDRFVEHLANGPAPERAWSAETLSALREVLAADVVDLTDWELRADPDDRGLAAGWQAGDNRGPGWERVRAGEHWESQGFDQYTGVGWYRTTIDVPADWRGRPVRAVFEGVDDSYRLYLGGEEVARFGDPATGETVWLERTVAEIGPFLDYGAPNQIVLRVVDHQGAGGLHRPAFLTTGPVDARSDLVH